MGQPKPPPGYVGVAEAHVLTGYAEETIRIAAQVGDLKGMQRTKGSRWFFKPEALRAWCGIDESVAS